MTKMEKNPSIVKDHIDSKGTYSKVPLSHEKQDAHVITMSNGKESLIKKDSMKSKKDGQTVIVTGVICAILGAFTLLMVGMLQQTLQNTAPRGGILNINLELHNSTLMLGPQPKATAKGTKVLVYDGKQKYVTWPDPPPKDDLPSVARYVMHISEFGSLATNSTHKGIEGYPFVNVFSVSDGPYNKSTGTPYFYFTPLELSVIDIKANNKVSLTVTEAQSDYCNKNGFDPEDPRCSHAIFTGIIKKIEKDTEEENFARNALFSRHAEMSTWPSGHDWFFAKMEIQHIYLLDYFGGAEIVGVQDYFAADPFKNVKNN